jgi:RND family efflux transporter MFP subunit
MLSVLAPAGACAQEAARVEVAEVVQAPIRQNLNLSGSLRSPQLSELSSQVDGYVTDVPVQAGDHVQPGQVVIRLDDTLPQLELERLEAALLEAQSQLADQRRRSREAEDLMNENNFSRSEFESLQAEAVAREARLAQIKAQTAMQRTRVERHRVKAPFAGVIIEKRVEVGQRISGAVPLLQIASMDPIWAEVQLPEQYLGRVHAGSTLLLQTPTAGDAWIEASVSRVVPVSTQGARTFLVRSELANKDWSLAPGMSIKVRLELDSGQGGPTLQVPLDAVVRRTTGETGVWLVVPGTPATVDLRPVSLGRRAGPLVEVVRGDIRAGDKVVTRGNESLRAGQAVALHGEQAIR